MKFKKNKKIIAILLLFIVYIFMLLIEKTGFMWDATVYLGMSKYIVSFGKLGFYETIRPPFFPFLIGIFSFIMNKAIAGHLIVIVSALISIFLVYLISKELFGYKKSLIPVFLFSIAPTFIFYSSKILNGIPSMTLTLLSVYLFIKKKNLFFVGLIAGLSALTRFPNILIIFSLSLFILIENIKTEKLKQALLKTTKKCSILILGFIVPLIPYLTFNYFKFGNILFPFQQASETISIVSQSVNKGIFYYPTTIFLESIFLVFFFVGFFFIFREKKKQNPTLLFFIISLTFMIYYSTVGHKEMRYILIIFPYLFICSFYGFNKIIKKSKNKNNLRKAISIIIIFCILQSIALTTDYYRSFAVKTNQDIQQHYYGANLTGFSVVSSPEIFAYQDIDAEIIYWTRPGMFEYYEALSPDNYLINTCNLFCLEKDKECNSAKQQFIQKLKENYNMSFKKEYLRCTYYLFN